MFITHFSFLFSQPIPLKDSVTIRLSRVLVAFNVQLDALLRAMASPELKIAVREDVVKRAKYNNGTSLHSLAEA